MIFIKLIILLFLYKINCQSLSKYELTLDRLFIPKSIVADATNLRVTNYNRTVKVLTGSFDILKPIDDNMSAILQFYIESGNEYKRIYKIDIEKICSAYKNEDYYIPKYFLQTTFPTPVTCPIPVVR